MKSSRFLFVPAFLIAGALIAQDAQVTPLLSKDLADFPGKEGLTITVVYPPGSSDPIHQVRRVFSEEQGRTGAGTSQVKAPHDLTATQLNPVNADESRTGAKAA
jgi:hypothetical protein